MDFPPGRLASDRQWPYIESDVSREGVDPELEQWRERGRRNGLAISPAASVANLREAAETISKSERQLAYQHGYEAAFLGALRERIAEAAEPAVGGVPR